MIDFIHTTIRIWKNKENAYSVNKNYKISIYLTQQINKQEKELLFKLIDKLNNDNVEYTALIGISNQLNDIVIESKECDIKSVLADLINQSKIIYT